jgi:hypothetical protein
MTRNVPEAEDLTQEAFLQVFHKVGTFRGDSAFSSWLTPRRGKHGVDETSPAQVPAHAFARRASIVGLAIATARTWKT